MKKPKTLLVIAFAISTLFSVKAQTDKTSLITNPSFETGNNTGWTWTGTSGYTWVGPNGDGDATKDGSYMNGVWNASIGDIACSQSLTGLPSGYYKVTALVTVQSTYTTTQRLFATTSAGTKSCLYGASNNAAYSTANLAVLGATESYSFGGYAESSAANGPFKKLSVITQVTDGNLTLGVRCNGKGSSLGYNFAYTTQGSAGFFKFDGFTLTDVSSVATLDNLTLNIGSLDATFDANTTTYSATLPAGTTTVTPTAVVSVEGETISGNGAVDVSTGTGTSTIVVTALDGTTTKTYTINYHTGVLTPTLSTSVSYVSLDELNTTATITVTGTNILDEITMNAPAGITLSPSSLPLTGNGSTQLTITYNPTSISTGYITLGSGTASTRVRVIATRNADNFTALYPNVTNLISDPYMNSISNYGGWGNHAINTDTMYVLSGSKSATVFGSNGGSLDCSLNGKLVAKTDYRVNAKIYVVGGIFQLGFFGLGITDFTKKTTTTGTWENVDIRFTTGASPSATNAGMYFNNYGIGGTTGYIDNLQMYAIPKVYPSSTSLSYLGVSSKKIAVRAQSLTQDITITAPAGFTTSLATMPATVSGSTTDSLTISFVGPNSASGYVYFASGTAKDSIQVTGTADPTLLASTSYLSLDERLNTGSFTVTGGNLTAAVTMTAPAGITLTPSSLPSTANGSTVSVSYDGNAISTGYITLTSGTATQRVRIKAVRNADNFTPLFETGNLISNPYMDDLSTYGGWGNKTIVADTAIVYSGSKCALTSGKCGGSIDYNLSSFLLPNSNYRVKAMVNTNGTGTFKIGVSGVAASSITNEVSTAVGEWKAVDFTFTTSATLSSPNLYFNSCETQTGTTGLIDNWELYYISTVTGLQTGSVSSQNVYVQNGKIAVNFNLTNASTVEFAVYNSQGMQILKDLGTYSAGRNQVVLKTTIKPGVYIVKTSIDGKYTINKIIL